MAKILLAGFDLATSQDLSRKLSSLDHESEIVSFTTAADKSYSARLLFLCADDARGPRTLKSIRETNAEFPIVLVSRMDDAVHWIEALEAGATDYCADPVDTQQLRWIVDAALNIRNLAVAVA